MNQPIIRGNSSLRVITSAPASPRSPELLKHVQVVFTETDNPATLPASVVLKMPEQAIDRNGWTLDTLPGLSKVVIAAFNLDYGYLYDNSHAVRPEYTSRMFEYDGRRVPRGLFWINYYNPGL